MHTVKIASFALALMLFTSCAHFRANSSGVADQVDAWLDRNQYDKALETIAAMSDTHADFKYLTRSIPDIERARQKYIQSVLNNAKSYEPQQDWVNAQKVIDQGLSNLPKAPELKAQAQFYFEKRQERTSMDEAAILIARAQYIIDSRPYQESKLYNTDNRFFAQQEFNKFLNEALSISRELYVIGYQYWQNNQVVQARKALTLSIKTAPNELSSELLSEILTLEQTNRTVARKQQLKKITELLPELKSSFYERINFEDYLGAQKVLNEMNALNINETTELQSLLDKQTEKRVEILITSGNTLYNSGYLQEAILRWNEALLLAPDNKIALQQLDRAEKFLANLERWKETP
jgi:hypothetical protein